MDEKEAEARPVMGTIFLVIYMFRTDAQLCPVTQPVVPLHNRPSRYPTGSDKQELGGDTLPAEILCRRRYSSLASGVILICLGVQTIWVFGSR